MPYSSGQLIHQVPPGVAPHWLSDPPVCDVGEEGEDAHIQGLTVRRSTVWWFRLWQEEGRPAGPCVVHSIWGLHPVTVTTASHQLYTRIFPSLWSSILLVFSPVAAFPSSHLILATFPYLIKKKKKKIPVLFFHFCLVDFPGLGPDLSSISEHIFLIWPPWSPPGIQSCYQAGG